MLVHTASSRYGGDPDPDEELERRWQPISQQEFLPMAASVSCFIVSSVTTGATFVLLHVIALALFLCFVKAAWSTRGGPSAPGGGRSRRD